MCLIARVADNLISFQSVVKKRLSTFELLKRCCRTFQQQSQTDFVSNQRAQVLHPSFFSVQNELLCSKALPYTTLSREKGCQFFLRYVSDICYSQSLQSICGSQAVEHSERHYPQFRHSPRIISCIARYKQGYVAYYMGTSCQEQA